MVTVKFVVPAATVLVGVRSRMRNVSLFSAMASLRTTTETDCVVSPAANESRPLVAT